MKTLFVSSRLIQMAICLLVITIAVNPERHVFAHGGGGDIALFTTANQTDVGFAILDDQDDQQIFFDPDINAFSAVLIPLDSNPVFAAEWVSPEPGFDANEGALPGDAAVAVSTLALSYWDGVGGTVSFSPAAGVRGYYEALANTHDDGGYHDHPYFGLDDLTANALPIPEGVYLGKMRVSVAGLDDSAPYYLTTLVDDVIGDAENRGAAAEELGAMVLAYLADPQNAPEPEYGGKNFKFFADAVAYAQAIPEPGTAALCAMALLVLSGIRQRGLTSQ